MPRLVTSGLMLIAFVVGTANAGEADRHRVSFGIAATQWSEMADLEAEPVDAIAEASGGFDDSGIGFEVGYRYRVGGDRSHWFVGGEFIGYLHGYEGKLVARDAVTGETMSIELRANWGNITGCFRYVWRPTKSPEIVAGAGLGLYMLRISESLEDFGNVDRYESDTSLGGYGIVGLRFPIGKGKFSVRVDALVNVVEFDDFGATFEGQKLEGPVASFIIGSDYSF